MGVYLLWVVLVVLICAAYFGCCLVLMFGGCVCLDWCLLWFGLVFGFECVVVAWFRGVGCLFAAGVSVWCLICFIVVSWCGRVVNSVVDFISLLGTYC